MRTQLECVKHEVEASKNEINDLNKENERINSLVNLKRNDFKHKYPTNSIIQILPSTTNDSVASTTINNNNKFRSNTPKGNF